MMNIVSLGSGCGQMIIVIQVGMATVRSADSDNVIKQRDVVSLGTPQDQYAFDRTSVNTNAETCIERSKGNNF